LWDGVAEGHSRHHISPASMSMSASTIHRLRTDRKAACAAAAAEHQISDPAAGGPDRVIGGVGFVELLG
jgi:hypothetical protein